MNKADLLKEFLQQANNSQKTTGDSTIDLSKVKPQDTSKVVNIVQQGANLKKQIGDLKKNQGVQNEDENVSGGDNKEAFYKEMIDNLLDTRYGLTYFTPKEGTPCFQTMSDEDKQRMSLRYSGFGYPAIIAQLERGELHNVYISLQNILSKKNENLVSNKLFSIIAENEIPSISKQDFINYITNKRV